MKVLSKHLKYSSHRWPLWRYLKNSGRLYKTNVAVKVFKLRTIRGGRSEIGENDPWVSSRRIKNSFCWTRNDEREREKSREKGKREKEREKERKRVRVFWEGKSFDSNFVDGWDSVSFCFFKEDRNPTYFSFSSSSLLPREERVSSLLFSLFNVFYVFTKSNGIIREVVALYERKKRSRLISRLIIIGKVSRSYNTFWFFFEGMSFFSEDIFGLSVDEYLS